MAGFWVRDPFARIVYIRPYAIQSISFMVIIMVMDIDSTRGIDTRIKVCCYIDIFLYTRIKWPAHRHYVRFGRYPRMQLHPAGALTFMAFGNWMLLLYYTYSTASMIRNSGSTKMIYFKRIGHNACIYFLFRIRNCHWYRVCHSYCVGIVRNLQLWLNTVCFYLEC